MNKPKKNNTKEPKEIKDPLLLTQLGAQKQFKMKVFYGDIEAVILPKMNNRHFPIAIGIMDNRGKYKYKNVPYSENIKNLEQTFLIKLQSLLESIKDENSVIYFHNLGKYDGYLLLNPLIKMMENNNKTIRKGQSAMVVDVIERSHILYEIKIKTRFNKTIHLRDSLLFINVPLDDFTKFGLTKLNKLTESQQIYSNMMELWKKDPKTINRLMKRDIEILQEGFNTFIEVIKEMTKYDLTEKSVSISGLSFTIFRTKYYKEKETPIYKPTKSEEEFIRSGYYGGIVDIYKPTTQNAYHYDINSMYPSELLTDLPIGKPKWEKIHKLTEETYGFVEAYVEIPECRFPPLPIKNKIHGLILPTGTFKGVFFSDELHNAVAHGAIVSPIKYLKYERGQPLKKFIEDFYNFRLQYPDGHPFRSTAKLILNTIYGRFGLRSDLRKTKIIKRSEYENFCNKHAVIQTPPRLSPNLGSYIKVCWSDSKTINQIKFEDPNKTDKEVISKYELQNAGSNAAIQIAAACTAKARVSMHKFKNEEFDPIYTDTDSIIVTKKLPNSLVSQRELGKMKFVSNITEGIFPDIKTTYIKTDEEDTKGTIKFKGVPKNQRKDTQTIKNFFEEAIINPNAVYEFISKEKTFTRDYKTNTIIKQDFSHNPTRTLDFGKRIKIYQDGIWVDTKPIHLDE